MNIKINDTIIVRTGDDKGKTGKVIGLFSKKGKVLIDGVNTYKRAHKAQGNAPAGIVTLSRPINASSVMIVCPHCGKPTRPSLSGAGHEKIRLCRLCQKPLTSEIKKITKSKK